MGKPNSSWPLSRQVAAAQGGSRGIGKAIALKRAFAGAHVVADVALDLVRRIPEQRIGTIAWSHKYLEEIGRRTVSPDGRSVLVAR